MMKELKLGSRVNYVRLVYDNEGIAQEVDGMGTLAGYHLSLDQRVQVRVLDGGQPFNIDYNAINATDVGKRRYFDHLKAVHQRAEEINAEVKALVAKGNAEIEAMNTAYLGPKVEIQGAEANDNASSENGEPKTK